MLSDLLTKIEQVRVVADAEVDEVNFPQTLGARRGRQKQAQEELTRLKRDYTREMLRSAVFVVVTGTEADAFAKTAEKAGTFWSRSEAIYDEMASKVNESLFGGRESTKFLFDILTRSLEEKAHDLELASYNQLQFSERYDVTVKTREDFANLAFTAISEQVGSEIVGINAAYSLCDRAIEAKHAARYTAIALTVPEDKALMLASDLRRLTPRVSLVVAGEASPNLKTAADVVTKVMSVAKVQRKKGQSDEEYATAQQNASQTVINEKAVEDALVQIKKSLAK